MNFVYPAMKKGSLLALLCILPKAKVLTCHPFSSENGPGFRVWLILEINPNHSGLPFRCVAIGSPAEIEIPATVEIDGENNSNQKKEINARARQSAGDYRG